MSFGETIDNWRGEPIEIARSPSGVVLVRDYVDNLIRSPEVPWPPPALVSKLVADDRVAARWPPTLADAVSKRLGHCTPLQSINSDDAITWSFFGRCCTARVPCEQHSCAGFPSACGLRPTTRWLISTSGGGSHIHKNPQRPGPNWTRSSTVTALPCRGERTDRGR